MSLSTQYRMAEDIQLLANTLMYGSALQPGNQAVASAMLHLPRYPLPGLPQWLSQVKALGIISHADTDMLALVVGQASGISGLGCINRAQIKRVEGPCALPAVLAAYMLPSEAFCLERFPNIFLDTAHLELLLCTQSILPCACK